MGNNIESYKDKSPLFVCEFEDDYETVSALYKTMYHKGNPMWCSFSPLILWCVIFIVLKILFGVNYDYIFIIIVAAALLCAFADKIFALVALNKSKKANGGKPDFNRFEIYDDEILLSSNTVKTAYKSSTLTNYYETRDYFVLRTNVMAYMILKKDCFTQGSADDFRLYIDNALRNNGCKKKNGSPFIKFFSVLCIVLTLLLIVLTAVMKCSGIDPNVESACVFFKYFFK